MPLPLETLTDQILEAACEASNELGSGFLESVYEGALYFVLQDMDLQAERQVPIPVHFRNHVIGQFCSDLLVEGQVILELKAAKALAPEHVAQTLNYLKATGVPVAMLLNFGTVRLEYRRFDNRFSTRMINRDEGDAGDD